MIDIGLTPKEKNLLYEDLLKKVFGNRVWSEFVGAPDGEDLNSGYTKLMNSLFGEKWKSDIGKMKLI